MALLGSQWKSVFNVGLVGGQQDFEALKFETMQDWFRLWAIELTGSIRQKL